MQKRTNTEKIDHFIPFAEAEADKIMENNPNKSEQRVGADGEMYSYDFWTQHFHKAMNRMTREKGLRNI